MYPSFIPMTPSTSQTQQVIYVQQKPITDTQIYFAYFSLYILFPLLYNMLVQGNKSIVMVLWRYITSGVFDTVSYIKELATDLFYASLRMFGQYSFSTYTVVKDGREIFTSSSMFYYYKSDVKTVYRIDRAKYQLCKWIDRQCAMFFKTHGEKPIINDTENHIYDFILHKVDDQPYVRIHRGDFNGRTHTLITDHYRPYRKSYQFASEAELTVKYHESSVEPPMCSNDANADETNTDESSAKQHTVHECFPPKVFKINLKYPNNYFLEKNELLDAKFLKWKLYNEFGSPDIARYLNSLFYNFKVVLFYNECMREEVEKTKAEVAIDKLESTATASASASTTSAEQAPLIAYNLTDKQSVIVGHTYVVKVDSLLRCPVFESNEKNVFDIDGVLTSYYECSDTECDEDDDDSSSQSSDDSACENVADRDEGDGVTADENDNINTEQKSDYDETEFEVIQESTS
jgi:hypothetical protein